MTELIWDKFEDRIYEVGVDRGVLYPPTGPGVVWNGLVAIVERDSDGEIAPYYYDGKKRLNFMTPTEFEATLEAFTYPDEFEACIGYRKLGSGITVSNQPHQTFGLSYRTRVGSYEDGTDYAYKIHIIYNALAWSDDREYRTLSSEEEPATFSWSLQTTPVDATDSLMSAHLIIDSRDHHPNAMAALEAALYGIGGEPYLPMPQEVSELLGAEVFVLVYPNKDVVPNYLIDGAVVLTTNNQVVSHTGSEPYPNVRPVHVIQGSSPSLLTLPTKPGDLAYDETTGVLYQIT